MSRPIAVIHPLTNLLIRYYRSADKSRQEKFRAELLKLRDKIESSDNSPGKATDATFEA